MEKKSVLYPIFRGQESKTNHGIDFVENQECFTDTPDFSSWIGQLSQISEHWNSSFAKLNSKSPRIF